MFILSDYKDNLSTQIVWVNDPEDQREAIHKVSLSGNRTQVLWAETNALSNWATYALNRNRYYSIIIGIIQNVCEFFYFWETGFSIAIFGFDWKKFCFKPKFTVKNNEKTSPNDFFLIKHFLYVKNL